MRLSWTSLFLAVLAVALGASADDPQAGLDELQRLRQENAALREENQKLRRLLAEPTEAKFGAPAAGGDVRGAASASVIPAQAGTGYWLSKTGKRHNSRCRYYQTSSGSPCSATDGTPCKLCGG